MSEDTKKIHLLKVNATAFDNILTKANNAINSKSVVETSHGGTGLVEVDANALMIGQGANTPLGLILSKEGCFYSDGEN